MTCKHMVEASLGQGCSPLYRDRKWLVLGAAPKWALGRSAGLGPSVSPCQATHLG